jgi:hypothetical protein
VLDCLDAVQAFVADRLGAEVAASAVAVAVQVRDQDVDQSRAGVSLQLCKPEVRQDQPV